MRFLDIIENKRISERFETAFRASYAKTPAEIFRNPTKREIKYITDHIDNSFRAFLVGDDILAWNTFSALHETVRRELNLDDTAIPIVVHMDNWHAYALITDASKNTPIFHSPDVGREVASHPWFAKYNLSVEVGYFDEAIFGPWDELEDEGLTEAPPVADIQTYDYSPDERRGSLKDDPRNWALVSKPRMQERIHRVWRNSKHDYYLYFFNLPRSGEAVFLDQRKWDKFRGVVSVSEAKMFYDLFRKEIADFDMPDPVPGAITVLVFQNANAEHPLTPWIIGHRLGHGIADKRHSALKVNMINTLEIVGAFRGIRVDKTDLFTMKSARDGYLEKDELIYELIAQYIVKGKILLNKTSEQVEYKKAERVEDQLNAILDNYFEKFITGNYLISY